MKKFEQKDIFINTLKTYPKVKIFAYSGKFYYNSEEDGPKLNNFLPEISQVPSSTILLESEEPLITEDGDYIVIE